METIFDISQDELPIFLAEVDEHLQALDDVLIKMERLDIDAELLNTAFRSAHTLKGMAGIIAHERMTRLTHTLETVFDRIRKNTIPITSGLIDLSLDAVDGLRLLRDEVIHSRKSDVDVQSLIEGFERFSNSEVQKTAGEQEKLETKETAGQPDEVAISALKKDTRPEGSKSYEKEAESHKNMEIKANIDPDSVASAARAFQLMLALQELGEILVMKPSLAEIETSHPVREFSAQMVTNYTPEQVYQELSLVSEVSKITINDRIFCEDSLPVTHSEKQSPAAQKETMKGRSDSPKGSSSPRPSEIARRGVDMTVRTSVERLDTLMNLVGELITDRNHLTQIRNRLNSMQDGSKDPQIEILSETVTHLGRITDQLQEEVMRIRMTPISNVFHKFPRMVRDMAQKTGKLVEVVIQGEDTELDRSMIEEINDPLIHLVRNAIDHGIETPEIRAQAGKPKRGVIKLTAWHEQGRIFLVVEDDGGGINTQKLRRSAVQKGLITAEEAAGLTDEQAVDLVFLPGLSTSEKISDISGRGVGMDIVHTNIQRVNGTIQVETTPGYGTKYQIVLPLTLAIVPTLLVEVKQTILAVPLVMVTETLRLTKKSIKTIRGQPVIVLRNTTLPLVGLKELFGMGEGEGEAGVSYAVVVHTGKLRAGLVVDSFRGQEEVVVKSMGALIGDIPGISSAAILGDGKVALILDVPGLFKLAGIR